MCYPFCYHVIKWPCFFFLLAVRLCFSLKIVAVPILASAIAVNKVTIRLGLDEKSRIFSFRPCALDKVARLHVGEGGGGGIGRRFIILVMAGECRFVHLFLIRFIF